VVSTIALLLLCAGVSIDIPAWYLAAALALVGLGSGLSSGPATTAAVESAPRSFAGEASGTLSAIRFSGALLGASGLSSILSVGADPSVGAFRVVFALLAVAAALSLVAALRIHTFPESAS
jgi:hypothetical protein